MTNRDRAWRRRTERILTHRDDYRPPEATAHPVKDFKQHQPGKLTHAQTLRQDGALRSDAEEAFMKEEVIRPELA